MLEWKNEMQDRNQKFLKLTFLRQYVADEPGHVPMR